jgi:hypothetical protein
MVCFVYSGTYAGAVLFGSLSVRIFATAHKVGNWNYSGADRRDQKAEVLGSVLRFMLQGDQSCRVLRYLNSLKGLGFLSYH